MNPSSKVKQETFIRGQTFGRKSAPSMPYKIFFTKSGRNTYNNCIDYILKKFKDPFTANSLNTDIEAIIAFLETNPYSCPLCDNPKLSNRNIRKIHLRKHKYKIFYHILDNKVIIDAVTHDSQDFEKAL